MMTAKQMISFLVWFLLLSLPIAAQEIYENITEKEQQFRKILKPAQEFMLSRGAPIIFEKDINAYILTMLSLELTNQYASSIREEFGITEEHQEMLSEQMKSTMGEVADETHRVEQQVMESLLNGATIDDLHLNKELCEQMDTAINSLLEAIELPASEVFTDEQREKADGMILALTGGLESPFFSERHMVALGMTNEQKKKFAAINEELKPERDKMVGEFARTLDSVVKKGGKDVLKNFIDTLSILKDYGREIKKRRSEILTSEQIAKAMKLSKLPKALSLSNLLPKWTPNAGSWKPGDPLPEGLVPNNPQPAPRFPIGEQY